MDNLSRQIKQMFIKIYFIVINICLWFIWFILSLESTIEKGIIWNVALIILWGIPSIILTYDNKRLIDITFNKIFPK